VDVHRYRALLPGPASYWVLLGDCYPHLVSQRRCCQTWCRWLGVAFIGWCVESRPLIYISVSAGSRDLYTPPIYQSRLLTVIYQNSTQHVYPLYVTCQATIQLDSCRLSSRIRALRTSISTFQNTQHQILILPGHCQKTTPRTSDTGCRRMDTRTQDLVGSDLERLEKRMDIMAMGIMVNRYPHLARQRDQFQRRYLALMLGTTF
jgi:hypothetical protein